MMTMRARPVPGRSLGWTAHDLATVPYARHWNPVMGELSLEAQRALLRGPVAEPLVPPMREAVKDIAGAEIQSGFTLTGEGALHLALRTDLPDVTPAMIDWWFGWHSDRPERYKLWHPRAHVHAAWAEAPPDGTQGRARYLGRTSIVDEYIGSALGRFAIRFVPPAEIGLYDARVEAGEVATAICARVGVVFPPVDAGHLLHHVERTSGGSVMRSRFWIGPPYAAPRQGGPLSLALSLGKQILRPTEEEARALLVHCAEEMAHLATFLPALHRELH